MRALIITVVCCATFLSAGAQPKMSGGDPLVDVISEARAGHLEAALAALDAAQKNGAAESTVLGLRGAVHLEQEKLDEAAADFRAALEKEPGSRGPALSSRRHHAAPKEMGRSPHDL